MIQHFQNEVVEIRGENDVGGRLAWVPMNPSPKQYFVAARLVKRCVIH